MFLQLNAISHFLTLQNFKAQRIDKNVTFLVVSDCSYIYNLLVHIYSFLYKNI